ncbi:hypothetical protein BJY52DRAFT_1244368 [Lactarius psammicola]|nr:hypothetical protein BJY52DRAFT_1244368 [Lactarius psammicola]
MQFSTKQRRRRRPFETQKIVKKLKAPGASLGKKNTEKLALETELDTLKATDHNQIGVLALKSKLKKDKFLSNEPSIQTAISKLFPPDVTLTSKGVANKLESRLLSSRTLSEAVNGVISSLCSALKPTEGHGDDVIGESGRIRNLRNVDLPVVDKSRATLEVSEVNSEHSIADRVNPSEADTDDESDNSAESKGDTGSDDNPTTGVPIPHLGGAPKAPGANSVFLPTLSNGFIPGGSDTDWSDGEAKASGGVRKNRRGQRARRA